MQTIIIIGSSAAGLTAASILCRLSKAHVVCLSRDTIAYNTCLLSGILMGKRSSEDTHLMLPEKAQGTFTIRYGVDVQKIDAEKKELLLASGEVVPYDRLLIATGSRPRLLPNHLYKLPGVFAYHTLEDVIAVKKYITEHSVTKAIVIGAGINGLECAAALKHRGIEVTVLEREAHVLKHMLNAQAVRAIESTFEEHEIRLLKNVRLETIEADLQGHSVLLSNGSLIRTQLVISAIGSTPNISLACDAGLNISRAIQVNEYMQTSNEHIFAAGDCIEFFNPSEHANAITTLWHDAIAQGMIAAYALAGQPKKYSGAIRTVHTQFFGKALVICGNTLSSAKVNRLEHPQGFSLLYLDAHARLEGFVLWGHTASFSNYKKMILNREIFT